MKQTHLPVLLKEVLDYLKPKDGGVYVDGNLGLGGHTEAVLKQSSPSGRVIGFEWDEEAINIAKERLAVYGDRVQFVRQNFARMKEALNDLGVSAVDGVLLDLGVSSLQLDKSGRGFSFKGGEPLDMRMDNQGKYTAADMVNTATKEELADIFYHYGEERQARRIADFIVQERKRKPITTTDHLVDVIKKAVPSRFYPKKIHVATKVFQALRIAVNHEFENLSDALATAPGLLRENGRLCVISFHSIEDRLVKQAFQKNSSLQIVTKKPVIAGTEECAENPRARSAKLRVALLRGTA